MQKVETRKQPDAERKLSIAPAITAPGEPHPVLAAVALAAPPAEPETPPPSTPIPEVPTPTPSTVPPPDRSPDPESAPPPNAIQT